jgi:sulfur-carrier protein
MIRLVLLGKLADLAGRDMLELPGPLGWHDVLAAVPPALADAAVADSTKVALNGVLVPDKAGIAAKDGDEIALLPPVSGG